MEKEAINAPKIDEPIKNAVTHIRVYRRTHEKAQRIANAMGKTLNDYFDLLIDREYAEQEKFILQTEALRAAAVETLHPQPEKQSA